MPKKRTVFLLSNTSWYLYNFHYSTLVALAGAGYRVICLTPTDNNSELLSKKLGVEHVSLVMDGKSTGILKELKVLFSIFKTFREYRPDFVFNFTVKMNVYSGLVCLMLGIKYANNVSGLGTVYLHDSWLFRRVRTCYGFVNRAASTVFFQNEDDLKAFDSEGLLKGARTQLLPGSGIDLKRFPFAPLPSSGEFCFVMIARLLGDKGVREYAQACRLLKSRGIKARCLLIGPAGVSNRTAIAAEEAYGWQEEGILEYLGSQDDVRPWLLAARVLVLPSYREGMPRTVLEAAAMGRPAIVTDVPGCRQAIEPGVTGWLCEAKNAESLAQSMAQAVKMPTDELAEAGLMARERMETLFSETLVVAAYLKCLMNE